MLIRAGALAALLLSGSAAMAQECPLPQGAQTKLGGVDAATRLAYLRAKLNEDGQEARNWKWRWVGGYATIAVGQLAFASAIHPPDDQSGLNTADPRRGLFVGGVASAIGMLPLLLTPLKVGVDAPLFDAKVNAASTANPATTCALITEGESLMMRDAENEAFGAGWVSHVVNILYNGIVAVIIGAGEPDWPRSKTPNLPSWPRDWTNAAITGGVGALIGEAMVLSQPNNLEDAWKSYKSGALGSTGPKVSFGLAPGSYAVLSGTF